MIVYNKQLQLLVLRFFVVVLDVFSSFDGVTYKVHFRVLQYLQ